MASAPQFYSFDCSTFPTQQLGGNALWGEDNLVPLFDGFGFDQTVSPAEHCEALSSTIDSSYPRHHQYEVPDTAVLALPELNMSIASQGCQTFGVGYQTDHHLYEFGDECFSLAPDFKTVPTRNWEFQNNQAAAIEDSNMKVSRYSEEVRKERIMRYLKKRNQRNFSKTIKYACRKTLADRRIRVRGRFARNNEPCDQEIIMPQKIDEDITYIHKDTQSTIFNHNVNADHQMKKDDEEWLEEITSLMYLPYITS